MTAANFYDLKKRNREEQTATMQIRIYSYENRVARGALIFLIDKSEKMFCGLDQMCLIMEDYLDQYPVFEERLEYRFIDAKIFDDGWINEDCWMADDRRLTDSVSETSSDTAVATSQCNQTQKLAVRIYGRSNRSLQGELRVDNKKCCFRSGMELIRCIHQWLQMKYEIPERQGRVWREPQQICNI